MVKFGVTPEINALSTILIIITILVVVMAEKIKASNIKMKTLTVIVSFLMVGIIVFTTGVWSFSNKGSNVAGELNIFNWSDYIPQPIIDEFERRYNIKVNYSTFASNEEMLAKIMAGGSQYDVVVAADYMVDIMRKQNLIRTIDKEALVNLNNIGAEFKGLYYDPLDEYTVPYMRSAAVIVADTSKINIEDIKSYKDFWKKEYKDSIVMLDDPRGVIGITLKSLGYSLNETDKNKLKEAKDRLIELRANIKAYDSDNAKSMLTSGEATIGLAWAAEAAFAKVDNPNLEVILPEEGLFLQQDNFVIPKDAKNYKEAELFLNFILDPEVSIEFTKAYPYANCNEATYPMTDEEILKDISIFPPEEELKKGEYLKDIGDSIKDYDEIWNEIKN